MLAVPKFVFDYLPDWLPVRRDTHSQSGEMSVIWRENGERQAAINHDGKQGFFGIGQLNEVE